MRLRCLLFSLPLAALLSSTLTAQQSAPLTSPEDRAAAHSGPEWQVIAPHLPDPATASAAALETCGDVLRARRFPEDALDYYGYALARGGDVSKLLNKMGVVRLGLKQNELAREMFLRAVRARKNDAQAWNNLGVSEYAMLHYGVAASDYKRATRLDRNGAVFHSNLGMAYFETKNMPAARKQFAIALRLDPTIMQGRDSGGATAHVMGTQNYAELCFEMARLYAREQKAEPMRLWLAKASEGGYNVRAGLRTDVAFSRISTITSSP